MEASRVGCDGQLVDLRFVPCEMRPEKVFHFLDEWRLVEKMRFCITIAISSARSARRSRREWMVSSPSMRLNNAIVKTFFSHGWFRSNQIRTITEPTIRRQYSSRQVGV